jgi:hypothetical protein
MKYLVENTHTEEHSEHKTWRSAVAHGLILVGSGDRHEVRIIERDRDGEREYNLDGKRLQADGHYR